MQGPQDSGTGGSKIAPRLLTVGFCHGLGLACYGSRLWRVGCRRGRENRASEGERTLAPNRGCQGVEAGSWVIPCVMSAVTDAACGGGARGGYTELGAKREEECDHTEVGAEM